MVIRVSIPDASLQELLLLQNPGGGGIGKKCDKTLCEVFMYLIVCWKEGYNRSLKLYLSHSDPKVANFYAKISYF